MDNHRYKPSSSESQLALFSSLSRFLMIVLVYGWGAIFAVAKLPFKIFKINVRDNILNTILTILLAGGLILSPFSNDVPLIKGIAVFFLIAISIIWFDETKTTR